MKRVVFDIESLSNFFCIVFSGIGSDKILKLRITKNQNDRERIIKIARAYILIGHNCKEYDDVLLNYIIDTPNCTAESINKLSQMIIKRSFKDKFTIKRYKHTRYLSTIDTMTMLASSKLRVSLKHLQVMIKWHNVQEFDCDWDKPLAENRWDDCETYCVNDVLSLKAVCNTLNKEFELRDYVYKKTGLDVHSKDPVKIAELTMCSAIAKEKKTPVNQFMEETVAENEPISLVFVKDLLLPMIEFKTKRFQDVYEIYKNHVFSPAVEAKKSATNKFKVKCLIKDGLMFNFGLGGLHHDYGKSMIHKPKPNSKIIQSDVSSYYPSLRIQHLTHRFDPAFLTEYKKAYLEKAKGKATKDAMLEKYSKLRLNSTFGMYNSVFSPLHAPFVAYGTTINGQLLLAMLVERLLIANFDVIGTNTDSVNVHVPNDRWDEYKAICDQWEKDTAFKLDHDEFTAIYEKSCNDYIASLPNGNIKEKGMFVQELNLLKGYDAPVVKKALCDYFIKNISVENTIKNHKDIYDFCISTKMGVSKKTGTRFEAYHNGIKLQRTNRYFASISGTSAFLFKSPDKGITLNHVLKDSGVTIFNQYEQKSMKDYKINYSFYLSKINKIISSIEDKQLTLF